MIPYCLILYVLSSNTSRRYCRFREGWVFPMALAAQSRAMASFFEVFEVTHNDTPQSVGLLWTSDEPAAETST